MLRNIHIPHNTNWAILYINVVIFSAVFSYNIIASSNSYIPKPMSFLSSSIISMILALSINAYKENAYRKLRRSYPNRDDVIEWKFDNEHGDTMNVLIWINVAIFAFLQICAVISQYI